ncbi:hypothetical protein [Pseudomonas sp. EggHat1]|uniref:hypothetical protein n=1 Tax=Pseudomonas sp. EggHat1 TaxID=2761624 RepID=UPI0018664B31
MVRAILEGRKTVTRRVIKPVPQMVTDRAAVTWEGDPAVLLRLLEQNGRKCPYGQPGDRLWVRESFTDLRGTGIEHRPDPAGPLQRYAFAADSPPGSYSDDARKDFGIKWKPSIHMPRAACRMLLEITAVRVERLQDINEEQAVAEGVDRPENIRNVDVWDGAERELFNAMNQPRDRFKRLWADINGAESWDANPWVWVVEFKRVEAASV